MIPAFSYLPVPANQLNAHINPDLLCPITYEINPVDPDTRPLDYSLPVGAIAGEFSLGQTGSANYTIPLTVPPGTAGLKPEVALSYNSNAGNGLLGSGWNLSAGSSITRIPKNLYSSQTIGPDNKIAPGYNKGISLSDDDFAMDGARLYSVNGLTYGTELCEYFTELFNGSKVISHGQAGNGPVWFEVKGKDGKIIEYGNSEDSRIKSSTSADILFWNINKVTDLKGNYIEYKYVVQCPPQYPEVQFYLSEINFTGNDFLGLTPYNSVKFIYATKQDVTYGYLYGTKFKQSILLENVITYAGYNPVRKYQLNYMYDFFSQLYEIKEFGSGGEHFNSTVFKYTISHETSVNFKELLCPNGIQDLSDMEYWYYPFDFNGDGKSDILQCAYKKPNIKTYYSWTIYKNTNKDNHFDGNDSLELFHSENFTCDEMTYGDANGDGWDDIFVVQKYGESFNVSCYYTQLNSSPVFQSKLIGTINGIKDIESIEPVEINGDGRTDLMIINKRPQGNTYIFDTYLLISNNESLDPRWTLYDSKNITSAYAAEADKIKFGDFNGDGKNEILIQDKSSNNLQIYNYDNLSHSFVSQFTGGYIRPEDWLATGNFNGDSYYDLLVFKASSATWHIWYGDGTKFIDEGNCPTALQEDPNSNDNGFLVGDFNGDGLSDIYQAISNNTNTYTGITIYYSSGNAFVTGTSSINEHLSYWEVRYGIGDFNGDGNNDILSYNFPNPDNTLQSRRLKTLVINESVKPHTLITIANGLNHLTKFEYHPLTHPSFYERGSDYTIFYNSFGQVSDCQPPLYVLTKLSSSSGINNSLVSTEFSYKAAHIHKHGKGFLGFSVISQHDIEKDITSNKTYKVRFETDESLNEFCANALIESNITAGSTLISKETYTNQYKLNLIPYDPHPDCRMYLSFLNKTVSEDFLTNLTTTTDINGDDVDNYGNVSKYKVTYGNDGYKEVISTYTGVDGLVYWYPSQPDLITTNLKRPNDLAYTRQVHYIYYGETGGGGGGIPHSGNPDNIGLLRSVIADPGKSKMLVTLFEYDIFGNMSLKTTNTGDLNDRTVSYTYDTKGRFPLKVTNSLDQSIKSTCDAKTGSPIAVTDANNLTTIYHYDAFGRQKKITTPDNISTTAELTWITDNIPENAIYSIVTNTPGEPEIKSYFDKLNRNLRSLNGTFRDRNVIADTKYDEKGQLVEVTEPYYEGDGYPAESHRTMYYYITDGRIDYIQHPAFKENFEYAGNTTTVTNESTGRFVSTTKDGWNNTIMVDDLAGSISYSYYSSGLTKDITGVDQTKTEFNYDSYGRQTKIKDPDAGEHQYEYDAYGALSWSLDPNGNKFIFSYDVLGRVVTKTCNDGSAITYTYDTELNGIGHLSNTSYTNGITYSEQYDELCRLKFHTEKIDGINYKTSYKYDMYGNVSEIVYPSGFSVEHTYESGFLVNVNSKGNNKPIFTTNHFNERGQITDYTLGNGLITQRGYDAFGFPSSIKTGNVFDNTYLFDPPSANLSNHRDNVHGLSESFNYTDELKNRLNDYLVDGTGYSTSIVYSPNGNIESKSDLGATYIYDPAKYPPHAVYQITSPMGPHTGENLQSIIYTPFNKINILSHQSSGHELQLTYGPDFDRKKTELYQNGKLIRIKYFIGEDYEIEKTADGKERQLHYIFGTDGLAAIYVIENGKGSLYYVHKDYQGSWQSITDEKGGIVQEMSYDPWGRRRNPTTWTFTELPTEFIFDRGYTGHEHLAEFRLINMNGRVYDPLIARFLSPDSYVQNSTASQCFNRYSYCLNNPLLYSDPTGDYAIIDDILVAVVGGTMNLINNIAQGNIHGDFWSSIGQGAAAFGAGAVGGLGAIYPEFGGWIWGGAVLGATNAWLSGANSVTDIVVGAGTGVITSAIGGAVSSWAVNGIGTVAINGSVLTNTLFKGAAAGLVGGAVGGYASGFAASYIMTGGNISSANEAGFSGMVSGASTGIIMGAGFGFKNYVANKNALRTGKSSTTFKIQTTQIDLSNGEGGLNLYKWKSPASMSPTGWKNGDYFLYLPKQATTKLLWKANYSSLRYEMSLKKPIFETHIYPNGNLIPTQGFLNAERFTLDFRGWKYNPEKAAWMPSN